jgi:MarR family 2-MHQ and catechol resistance regulon transcriptional repressor
MPKPSRYRDDRAERLALSTYLKLTRASERLWDRLALGLQHEDLTPSQFGVLEALYHLGPLCQRDLGERILRSSGNMTMVVGNLERRGLVRRERTAGDRRFREVHLTGAGERLIRRVFPPHAAAITRALAVLTSEEQRALGHLCRKLGAA